VTTIQITATGKMTDDGMMKYLRPFRTQTEAPMGNHVPFKKRGTPG